MPQGCQIYHQVGFGSACALLEVEEAVVEVLWVVDVSAELLLVSLYVLLLSVEWCVSLLLDVLFDE